MEVEEQVTVIEEPVGRTRRRSYAIIGASGKVAFEIAQRPSGILEVAELDGAMKAVGEVIEVESWAEARQVVGEMMTRVMVEERV